MVGEVGEVSFALGHELSQLQCQKAIRLNSEEEEENQRK